MKLSLHQHIAMSWLIGAPVVFAPVIENAKRPDTGAVVAWGVTIVAVMILFTPLLLRWPPFRRWYGWTDALSERQRQALTQRDLRRYYQTAFDDGYVSLGRGHYQGRTSDAVCLIDRRRMLDQTFGRRPVPFLDGQHQRGHLLQST